MPGLSITRKANDTVVLVIAGERVTMTVTDVIGGRVFLNFQGSQDVRILRGELLTKENKRASVFLEEV